MIENQISEEITQQKLDEVLGYLQAVHSALPFLVGLSPLERQRMIKASDGARPFIRKAIDVAPYITDYLPRGLDVAEIQKDVALMEQLNTVMVATRRLTEQLRDTHALVTSEAYSGALQIYRSAKQAQGDAGLESAVRDMGARFERSSSTAGATGDGPQPDIEPELPPVPAPQPEVA